MGNDLHSDTGLGKDCLTLVWQVPGIPTVSKLLFPALNVSQFSLCGP